MIGRVAVAAFAAIAVLVSPTIKATGHWIKSSTRAGNRSI